MTFHDLVHGCLRGAGEAPWLIARQLNTPPISFRRSHALPIGSSVPSDHLLLAAQAVADKAWLKLKQFSLLTVNTPGMLTSTGYLRVSAAHHDQ